MLLDKQVNALAEDLVAFMQKKFGFERLPTIAYVDDKANSANLLCMTGGYDQENESITIYITDRHPKDILRSLAHEMLHHVQKCEGTMDGKDMGATVNPNYIMHDEFLKKIEADAFERGNICFREWEAGIKGDKIMNEAKKKKKKKLSKAKLKIAHKKAKKALKGGGFEKYGSRAKEVAYATMTKQALKEGTENNMSNENEKKEVVINDALKNAHNYSTVTRAMPETAAVRDEFVYQELLKKFGIKK